ncbi:MAG: hypothetical protein LUD47_00595 [Clostridia bacterium]|nr:hypothetical protein [Clostridia bacterium]
MAKDKTVQTVTPAPQVRRPVPAEEPRKKADVILEKIDCLLGTTNAIVGSVDRASSNTSYLSRQNSEIFERTLEENASLRQQIKYIAQQSQNVYDKVSEALSSLTKKIDDLQTSLDNQKPAYTVDDIVAAVMERINSGELADAVASRIDYDAINDGVEEVFADYFAAEEIEDAPAETVTTSSVTDVTVDTDEIARKVAELVSEAPVQEVISADAVATKVAEQLASGISGVDAEQLANYVIDKIREDGLYGVASSGDINYETLSKQIAQKINIEVSSASGIDYDRLASLVAYKISPESVEDEQIAEMFAVEEDEESIYADLKAEEDAEKPAEERHAEYTDEKYETVYEEPGYDETTMEEFNYEYLAELIADRMTEPGNMKIIADRVAQNLSVEDEVDVEELASVVASKISVESAPTAEGAPVTVTETSYVPAEIGIDYERFSAMVAEKLVEREDIVVDEFFDYEKLADLLAERVEWPHEENTTVVETRAETAAVEIDYDALAEKVAALIPATGAETEIDYDLIAEKVAALVPERNVEVDYDEIADKVAEEIPAAKAVEIDYDLIAEKVAALMPEPAVKEDTGAAADDAAQEIAADIDYELLSDLIAKRIAVPSVDIDAEEVATYVSEKIELPKIPSVTDVIDLTIDYEELSTLLAQKLMDEEYPEEDVSETEIDAEYVEEDRAEAEAMNETFQEVDYEILTDVVSTAVRDTILTIEIDYERIAKDIVDYINELDEAPFDDEADLPEEDDATETAGEGVDYARIGRIVQRGVTRGIENNKNYEELSDMVAQKVVEAIDEMEINDEDMDEELDFDFVDYGKVGDIVREVVTQIYEENRTEPASVEIPESMSLAKEDIDAVAELVAQNVAEVMPKDYDMQVDEEGCEAIAKAVYDRIDKEELAKTIVDYLSPAKDEIVERVVAVVTEQESPAPETDYDAVAERIAERMAAESGPATIEIDYDAVAEKVAERIPSAEPNAEIDYDAVAEKVAEKISFETEVVPVEIDYDVVADKVAERIPAPVETATVEMDYDAVAEKVAEKISVERGTEIEYKTEIDEESIDKISDIVLEEVKKYIDGSGRLEQKVDVVDGTTREIRDMLERGIVLIDDDNAEIYNGQETRRVVRETVEEAPEGEPAPAEETAGEEEETTEEQATEELMSDASAETAEVIPEQPVDDYVEDEEGLITISDIIGDIVIDEEDGETAKEPVEDVVIIIDQNVPKVRQHAAKRDENAPAVDFGNMMRYNRSFISRIIQGTDEVKTFYGRIKTGFLAYRKVNSTLSWGGERFNKGRETVARLKIRGKTLVLYLALNPQEFKETVYHQVDASDIKSVANTPMMVKVKSPLGAKKAIRLIDNLMARRHGIKQNVRDRDYVAMYPYETTEELIEEELIKTTTKPGKGDEE